MSVTAPATASLFARLRSMYVSGQNVPTNTKLSDSVSVQLDVLDRVLTKIEQTSTAHAVSQPAPELSILSEPIPVVSQLIKEISAVPPETEIIQPAWPGLGQASLALSQATDTLNSQQSVGTAKERFEMVGAPDIAGVDAGGSIQYIEIEPIPELPVEVEGYLQHVEDHQSQLPAEIVIASDVTQPFVPSRPLTPVVVLPITAEIEKSGLKKNEHWSIRWLVEWSRKLMKMFDGKIIYSQR